MMGGWQPVGGSNRQKCGSKPDHNAQANNGCRIDSDNMECGLGYVGTPEWHSPQLGPHPAQDT